MLKGGRIGGIFGSCRPAFYLLANFCLIPPSKRVVQKVFIFICWTIVLHRWPEPERPAWMFQGAIYSLQRAARIRQIPNPKSMKWPVFFSLLPVQEELEELLSFFESISQLPWGVRGIRTISRFWIQCTECTPLYVVLSRLQDALHSLMLSERTSLVYCFQHSYFQILFWLFY